MAGKLGRAALRFNNLAGLPGTVQDIIDTIEYKRNIAKLAELRDGTQLNINNAWDEQPSDIILGDYKPKDNYVQLPDEPSTISPNQPKFNPESAIAALRRFNMETLPMRGTDKRIDEQLKATNELFTDDINSKLPKQPNKVNFQTVDPTKDYYDEYGNLMIKGTPKQEEKERKSTLKEIPVKGKPGYKQLARIYDDNEVVPIPDTEELIKQSGGDDNGGYGKGITPLSIAEMLAAADKSIGEVKRIRGLYGKGGDDYTNEKVNTEKEKVKTQGAKPLIKLVKALDIQQAVDAISQERKNPSNKMSDQELIEAVIKANNYGENERQALTKYFTYFGM